jgi:uncharacterized protein with GYD domain
MGRKIMATYIALVNWTDQGIKNIKDLPDRLESVRELYKKHGCEMQDVYMTIGAYDMVVIMEAPDDETVATLLLKIASAGNVRTTTLKAFSEDGYRRIVGNM